MDLAILWRAYLTAKENIMEKNDLHQDNEIALNIERIAREMGLVIPSGSSGLVYWLPAGMRLREQVMNFSLLMHQQENYMHVKSPVLASRALFEKSGHIAKYSELMYSASSNDKHHDDLMLRPMSCPNHLSIYLSKRRSVSELPFKLFEFGEVFRNESSGSLAFLLRQRQFCQDDSHILALIDQVGSLALAWLEMAKKACVWLDCGEPILSLALRPEQRIGSDSSWNRSEQMLKDALNQSQLSWKESPGDGAFYGPKIELGLRDAQGRVWQMGVFQLDMNLPGLFGVQADGCSSDDIALIHHAVFGSIERAIGLILACKGKEIPPYMNPNALAILPVSNKFLEASHLYFQSCKKIIGERVWFCDYDIPLSAKIARAKEMGFSKVAVIGLKESQQPQPMACVDQQLLSPEHVCFPLESSSF